VSGKGWPSWAITALLIILVVFSAPAAAQEAEGLAISSGEMIINGIRLGESRNSTITVSNNKTFPVTVTMSAETPYAENLTPGYEPIPDTGWISLAPQDIELDPDSDQTVDITVNIPSSGAWGGKNYECWLRATFGVLGIFQVELDCRLLLSISTAYAGEIDWTLIGAIAGVVVVAGAVAYSNRRTLKKWAGRW
jgi:hypothetical protein